MSGGDFTAAGGTLANGIAKWNGSSWSALGAGVDIFGGSVLALAVSGSEVYVGGRFTEAGGTPVNRIAKWNGSSWSALGTGVNDPVHAIAVSGSDVYVGGEFSTAGCHASSSFARYFAPDSTPPETSVSSGPSGTITVNSATFTWTGTDNVTPTANLQYASRLDPVEASFSAFRHGQELSYRLRARKKRIVPIAMKLTGFDIERLKLIVGDL